MLILKYFTKPFYRRVDLRLDADILLSIATLSDKIRRTTLCVQY